MHLINFISENKLKILVLLIPLLILFLAFRNLAVLSVIIIIDIVLGYFMGIWHMRSFGIEFVLLVAVITGMAYGSVAGAVAGFLLITIHMIATQHVNVYLLWVIPGYSIAGFLAGSTTMSIATFGVYATIVLNLINLAITAIVFRQNTGKFLPFAITNIIFNMFLFTYIAPSLIRIIA